MILLFAQELKRRNYSSTKSIKLTELKHLAFYFECVCFMHMQSDYGVIIGSIKYIYFAVF